MSGPTSPKLDAAPTTRALVVRRWLWFVGGWSSLILAGAGALLPVLPCTPFVLLAAWCFSNSSPACHEWLLRSRVFGPVLRDWENRRGVRPLVKIWAVTLMLAAVTATCILGRFTGWPLAGVLSLAVCGLVVIWSLPKPR